MCQNSRFIYNPYARRSILVKCGKCEACQQEKASLRSQRIRNNASFGTLQLFITLTYTNDFVPYVLRSELKSDSLDVNVYRNSDVRYVFSRQNGLKKKKTLEISIVDKVYIPNEIRSDASLMGLVPLQKQSKDKIGVCLYSDFQKFVKRLRQILIRKYHVTSRFSYFVCSEYGSITKRPHFHADLSIPSSYEAEFRQAILEAWPYADTSRTARYIEIARDVACYVSSYVNGSSDIPECFKGTFDQKHHYSQHYGVGLDCFGLPALLEKIKSRDLHYYTRKEFDGTSEFNDVPYPAYVVNRFFPKFKGFSWCSSSSLFNIAREPENVCRELSKIENPLYHYNSDETYKIYVRLKNAQDYFVNTTGLSAYDFALYYVDVWKLFTSQNLIDSHKDIEYVEQYADYYDNGNDLYNGLVSAPTIPQKVFEKIQVDPNKRVDVLSRDSSLRSLYHRLSKQKKVTNYVMSHNGHNV